MKLINHLSILSFGLLFSLDEALDPPLEEEEEEDEDNKGLLEGFEEENF